jgi:hypothetical protein
MADLLVNQQQLSIFCWLTSLLLIAVGGFADAAYPPEN